MSRLDYATGERTQLQRPQWRPRWTVFEDSIVIERPDTARPETAAQRRRVDDLRRRQRADSTDQALRFNWNTPFLLSHHNPRTFYAGANKVLKSTNRGENLLPISPDLSTRDSMKIRISTTSTGGITPDVTGAETHCTIVSLAESSFRPGLLYAGTDDGKVWLTKNDGGTWDDLTGRFPRRPREHLRQPHRAVALRLGHVLRHVRQSPPRRLHALRVRHHGLWPDVPLHRGQPAQGRARLHPRDPREPQQPRSAVRGDRRGCLRVAGSREILQKFMTGLPTVPVHDLKIHPRDHELIAGTHGRSIWIVDIAPLEQLTDRVVGRRRASVRARDGVRLRAVRRWVAAHRATRSSAPRRRKPVPKSPTGSRPVSAGRRRGSRSRTRRVTQCGCSMAQEGRACTASAGTSAAARRRRSRSRLRTAGQHAVRAAHELRVRLAD